jgi:hypothetical protein
MTIELPISDFPDYSRTAAMQIGSMAFGFGHSVGRLGALLSRRHCSGQIKLGPFTLRHLFQTMKPFGDPIPAKVLVIAQRVEAICGGLAKGRGRRCQWRGRRNEHFVLVPGW